MHDTLASAWNIPPASPNPTSSSGSSLCSQVSATSLLEVYPEPPPAPTERAGVVLHAVLGLLRLASVSLWCVAS